MDKKNIFIVGGSSGIGLELVRSLEGNHHDVYVGSRTNATLEDFSGGHHIALDVKDDCFQKANAYIFLS